MKGLRQRVMGAGRLFVPSLGRNVAEVGWAQLPPRRSPNSQPGPSATLSPPAFLGTACPLLPQMGCPKQLGADPQPTSLWAR